VEAPYGKPERIASPLEIMLAGPIGGASFNNEFGRPNLGGLLPHVRAECGRRSARLPQADHDRRRVGNIRAPHAHKDPIAEGMLLIQLGGRAC